MQFRFISCCFFVSLNRRGTNGTFMYSFNNDVTDDAAEVNAATDREAKIAEIDERLQKLRSPFRTAEAFWVEEIIDPRETRPLLCDFARLAEPLRGTGLAALTMRP